MTSPTENTKDNSSLYVYQCLDCSYSWCEKQLETAKDIPRYKPCPKCESSMNIVIVKSK